MQARTEQSQPTPVSLGPHLAQGVGGRSGGVAHGRVNSITPSQISPVARPLDHSESRIASVTW